MIGASDDLTTPPWKTHGGVELAARAEYDNVNRARVCYRRLTVF